jgi:hypothetical protein
MKPAQQKWANPMNDEQVMGKTVNDLRKPIGLSDNESV